MSEIRLETRACYMNLDIGAAAAEKIRFRIFFVYCEGKRKYLTFFFENVFGPHIRF